MVTSAAVIMVAVFSIFATLSIIDLKMIGVGLASAVLIDATVVRGILVPAALALLGERAWYLPRWLAWLPGRRLLCHDQDAPAGPVPGAAVPGAAVPREAAAVRGAAVPREAAAVRGAAVPREAAAVPEAVTQGSVRIS